MRSVPAHRLLALVLAAAVVLASCASDDEAAPAPTSSTAKPAGTAPPATNADGEPLNAFAKRANTICRRVRLKAEEVRREVRREYGDGALSAEDQAAVAQLYRDQLGPVLDTAYDELGQLEPAADATSWWPAALAALEQNRAAFDENPVGALLGLTGAGPTAPGVVEAQAYGMTECF